MRVRLLAILLVSIASSAALAARTPLRWDPDNPVCEGNNVFYSALHKSHMKPCCPVVPGMCAGGVACPITGTCPGTGVACQPGPAPARPNVVLMITDDHGACQYGTAGECRSAQTGTPIVTPVTPNLDLLAGHGTVFPIAHNSAGWCFPSLASILTGRYQKSFGGHQRAADMFGTIARSLRTLDNDPAAPVDPYNPKDRIGGYCALLAGKLTGSLGYHGFSGRTLTGERSAGRTKCIAGAPGQPPRCGSEQDSAYRPTTVFRMTDIFKFLESLTYRVPGANPATFGMQNFMIWYAPRIPHQPLRSPQVIDEYLFGSGSSYPLGGLFNLGALCSGGSCPPTVRAMDENNFGTVYELDANIWWVDDGVREIRKYLAKVGQPHCRDAEGLGRFDLPQSSCPGTWATSFAYDLPRETIIIALADNGWHLPNSKHQFTENGYRTRMIVFDPRTLASVPDWDPRGQTAPPPFEQTALAHAVDVYPTILGAALGAAPGTQLCPKASDGSRCDGHDLRSYLRDAPGGPAAPETLRHALCGHSTQKSTSPTLDRYLLTRPGGVGRCTLTSAPACTGDGDCGAGQFCLGGHCMPRNEPSCSSSATCPEGSVCLGRKCRVAPACVDDADCASVVPGAATACVAHEKKWCRNAPDIACGSAADCPVCPQGGACGRLCEARQLKFYVGGATSWPYAFQAADLFLDPDENGLHAGADGLGKVAGDMSRFVGPYGDSIRRAACCLDDWWYDPGMGPSICPAGVTCPVEMTCNQ